MKNLIRFLVLIILVISCKKDSGGGVIPSTTTLENSISAKFNGVTYILKCVPDGKGGGGSISYTGGIYIFVTVALENIGLSNTRNIQIAIESKKAISTKTYSEDFTNDNNADQLIINYGDLNGVEYSPPDKTHINPLTLTITSLNNSRAEGTFSGNLYLDGEIKGKVMTITDGVFNLKYN